MPNFAERLRMQSIFGGGGRAFAPTTESPLAMLDQFINRLPPENSSPIQQIGQQIAQPELEPQSNVRVLGHGINPFQEAQLALKQRELESREKLAGESQNIRKGELDIKQQRTDVYKFKSENPAAKFIVNKSTGTMQAVNPTTGETVRDFGVTQLGEEDLINLNQKKALERIEAGGEQARETEKVRQEGRETLADINARHKKELEEFKTGQPSRSANLPTQQRVAIELKYNQLINQRPDLRSLVSRDQYTGDIQVADPGENPGMENQINYINNFLFGSGNRDVKLPNETSVKEPVKPTDKPKEETPEERLARLKKQAGITEKK